MLPLAVDWDAIEAHALQHGVREAARAFGISEDAVRQRSSRYGWLKEVRAIAGNPKALLPATMQPRVTAVTSAGDAARAQMQKLSSKSRLSLAKAVAKGAKHSAQLEGAEILSNAKDIKALADTGDKIHQWSSNPAIPTLRLELIASVSDSPPPLDALDVESVVSREGHEQRE